MNTIYLSALGYELKMGVIKTHLPEICKVILHGFLSGLGLTIIMPNQLSHAFSPVWLMVYSLAAMCLTMALCKNSRFTLFSIIGIQYLSIFAFYLCKSLDNRDNQGTHILFFFRINAFLNLPMQQAPQFPSRNV